ncbi:hypothetical protein Hanom_Chr11g01047261 [Helianthus anomalus]
MVYQYVYTIGQSFLLLDIPISLGGCSVRRALGPQKLMRSRSINLSAHHCSRLLVAERVISKGGDPACRALAASKANAHFDPVHDVPLGTVFIQNMSHSKFHHSRVKRVDRKKVS